MYRSGSEGLLWADEPCTVARCVKFKLHKLLMYTVPKLTDYSAKAMDTAVRELLSALEQEGSAVGSESDYKAFRDRWMARKNGVLTQINDLG